MVESWNIERMRRTHFNVDLHDDIDDHDKGADYNNDDDDHDGGNDDDDDDDNDDEDNDIDDQNNGDGIPQRFVSDRRI